MMNLFSIFDPTVMNIQMNWSLMMFPMILTPKMFWMIPPKNNLLWMMTMNQINKEIKIITKMKIYNIMMVSLFFMIMMTNLLGLMPYIFTSSSHMSMNMSLSMPIWMSLMKMGWMFNFKHMMIHQVPMNTPNILIPLMILIEFISNIIRPLTLSIRLTANIIAGHLLLTLMNNNNNNMNKFMIILIIISQSMLLMLEMAVAIIQAYVFIILISLYSNEI